MRAARARLLLGVLFAVVLLFSAAVDAHGDHSMDDLEADDLTSSSSSAAPAESPSQSVELPTFTVLPPFTPEFKELVF
jgi:hypothetical protein